MINAQHIILGSPIDKLILFEKDEALTALFPMDHPDYRERIKLAATAEWLGTVFHIHVADEAEQIKQNGE